MRKFLTLFALACLQLVCAQTVILDQSLLTQASFNSFTPYSVTGTQSWYFSATFGAICNGYQGGQSFENEDWFVSPAMDLSGTDVATLTFSHTRGNASVLNVGLTQGWYQVFATGNYTGDPATTTWLEVTGVNHNVTTAWQYVASGNLEIPAAAKTATSRIAFKYRSSATQSATWEIKNVKVTGQQAANPNLSQFKLTNWNTEWLGCVANGPSNESQQLGNVAAAMLSINADVYCLQEITNSIAYPTLTSLVAILGADVWEARMTPSSTDDCAQRQAIIFKKNRVQFVSASQLSSGANAQNDTYTYNWSNGRFPAVYNLNFVAGNNLVPVTIVNIHAKAEDDEASSYNRRLGASEALKTILDGSAYNSKNVVLTGDFNDYLFGTTSTACNCTASPYANFEADVTNYRCLTRYLTDANTTFGVHPLIEHFVISTELSPNYIAGSAAQETAAAGNIANFYGTTSNHLPVSTVFEFSTLRNIAFADAAATFTLSPNPVKDVLKIDYQGTATPRIFDLTGREVKFVPVGTNQIDVSALPGGVYLVVVDGVGKRFIKS